MLVQILPPLQTRNAIKHVLHAPGARALVAPVYFGGFAVECREFNFRRGFRVRHRHLKLQIKLVPAAKVLSRALKRWMRQVRGPHLTCSCTNQHVPFHCVPVLSCGAILNQSLSSVLFLLTYPMSADNSSLSRSPQLGSRGPARIDSRGMAVTVFFTPSSMVSSGCNLLKRPPAEKRYQLDRQLPSQCHPATPQSKRPLPRARLMRQRSDFFRFFFGKQIWHQAAESCINE